MSDGIRFYMDEHEPAAVVRGLRLHGVDVVTVFDMQMEGKRDIEHVRRATEDGRVIFTHDSDFLRPVVHGDYHCGIVYC